jgi:hypothetical protein
MGMGPIVPGVDPEHGVCCTLTFTRKDARQQEVAGEYRPKAPTQARQRHTAQRVAHDDGGLFPRCRDLLRGGPLEIVKRQGTDDVIARTPPGQIDGNRRHVWERFHQCSPIGGGQAATVDEGDAPASVGHGITPVLLRSLAHRTDKVDTRGKVTLRHQSQLFHIGIGRRWEGGAGSGST